MITGVGALMNRPGSVTTGALIKPTLLLVTPICAGRGRNFWIRIFARLAIGTARNGLAAFKIFTHRAW